ncbi:caspase family protein [Sorangium sp. So ce136]|uniref:caspase family protein n=1 Tax=Sorangium sp. So ce136 TaxID=3133284 RepID=UPI003F08F8BA
MRKALIIGIDYYEHVNRLHGCVNDAHNVASILERNGDGSVNFDVRLLTGTGPEDTVSRGELREAVQQLFQNDSDVALLYFAGHGHVEETGGYLMASDVPTGNGGLPLNEVMTFVNKSPAKNRVMILDSCHSGIAGNLDAGANVVQLSEGVTILTASAKDQYASEENGAGVFSALLVDALGGAAANLVGEITPGSVYAHIDQSLGSWDQRPLFKTNVKKFVWLRKVPSPISQAELRRLPEFFPNPGVEFALDPSFEPERGPGVDHLPPPNPVNTANFAVLQKLNRVNLVVPVDAPHMWHAAMESKSCKLTVLGEHYRRLVKRGRI